MRRGSGVYVALRDEGACATVLRVRVYYVVCEAVTAKLARFPLTVAGPQVTSVVQVYRPSLLSYSYTFHMLLVCLQCFDAVGWVSGRASGP